tara:strand:+ start:183 stop:311 length:129 start_codon:yes stop_codon:yes gene_type:complete
LAKSSDIDVTVTEQMFKTLHSSTIGNKNRGKIFFDHDTYVTV